MEVAMEALTQMFGAERLLWLVLGVTVGLIMGLIPGLGGVTGMAVLLSLVFGMEPETGIAMLLGMAAVTATSDTFAAVMLGIPGTAGSQATIMDGYPLAKQGQANLALGAAFSASLLGGLVGAASLAVFIPVAAPVVLAFGSPELFMLTFFGLAMVALLSQGAPGKALISGLFGMLLSTMGMVQHTGAHRFTGGISYLFDGVSLVPLAVGIFAIPEVTSLLVQRTSVAHRAQVSGSSVFAGIRTTFRHPGLVLYSSAAGSLLAALPGVGGAVIDWIVYGTTAKGVRKNRENFGRGDIRGVIAPESANNAKEGGTLIPTLLFGIPGGATAAVLLGGFALMGVQTGPRMAQPESLPFVLTIVWTLVLANVLGTLACVALSTPLSRLTFLPPASIAPFIIVAVFIASYQESFRFGDLVTMLLIGVLGVMMKEFDWPRPPLIIGFVLGAPAENYLWRSMSRYGLDWISRPTVIGIAAVIAVVLLATVGRDRVRAFQRLGREAASERSGTA